MAALVATFPPCWREPHAASTGAGVVSWSRCRSNRSGVAAGCWLVLAKSSR